MQAEIASPADVGFLAEEEYVWVSTKSAEGEAPRIVLDMLDGMRQTWHIPVVPATRTATRWC